MYKNKIVNGLFITFRILFAIFTWTVLVIMFCRSAISAPNLRIGVVSAFSMYKYYTMQTNLFVAIWLTLAAFAFLFPTLQEKLTGFLRGAITLYITITFLVFAIMLSSIYHPTGIDAFTNISSHYIVPILFIIDWLLTEKETEYKWLLLAYWIIYPILYLIFAIIHGTIYGNYLYFFLDISELGLGWFFASVGILIVAFLSLASMYIGLNHFIRKIVINKQTKKSEDIIL